MNYNSTQENAKKIKINTIKKPIYSKTSKL